jgi:predicted enzyme related to lactoylglutathione lyase
MSPMRPSVIEWQILATDPESVATFYQRVFDWQFDSDNPLAYRRVAAGGPGGIGGGIWPAPPETRNFVQLFINVDQVSEYVARAQELGATPIVPPQTLPDGSELAILLDPFGMAFGIMKKSNTAATR